MFSTNTQQDFKKALEVLCEDKGNDYTAGFCQSMLVEMINLLPKRKQKEFLKYVERINGAHEVEVVNIMSGQKVMQRRDTPFSCSVASEAYWSA
jgi:hypothetical protein